MQRRGYTTEAVRSIAALAFNEMGANRVEIRCDSRNVRSRRVAELAGFRQEAQLANDDRANDGSLRITIVYAMLPEDFHTGR
jgi:RimJ/RimL family protein N-acetyltransferase